MNLEAYCPRCKSKVEIANPIIDTYKRANKNYKIIKGKCPNCNRNIAVIPSNKVLLELEKSQAPRINLNPIPRTKQERVLPEIPNPVISPADYHPSIMHSQEEPSSQSPLGRGEYTPSYNSVSYNLKQPELPPLSVPTYQEPVKELLKPKTWDEYKEQHNKVMERKDAPIITVNKSYYKFLKNSLIILLVIIAMVGAFYGYRTLYPDDFKSIDNSTIAVNLTCTQTCPSCPVCPQHTCPSCPSCSVNLNCGNSTE